MDCLNILLILFMLERFTIPGRLLFMILAGVIELSIRNVFGYIVCVLTLLAAVYNVIIMAMYPEWTKKVMTFI